MRQPETGTIRNMKERGFGWIIPDRGGRDVWFHKHDSNILPKPLAHMRVQFVRGIDPRTGREAGQLVKLLNEPAPASQAEQGKDERP